MVAVRRSRLPGRALRRERLDGWPPRQEFLGRQRVVEDRQPDLVGQQPAHGNVLLAAGSELRPVLGHRGVEVEFAALGQQVGADRGRPLGAREHHDDAVLGPRPTGLHVRHTAPEIDHLLATVVKAERGADFAVLLEVRRESVPNPLEAGSHFAVDLARA